MSRLAARFTSRFASRLAIAASAALSLAACQDATAPTQSAERSPRPSAQVSAALGTATSYGFVCSSSYRWVRTNFPNMTSIGGGIENTYFRTDLYRWNGSSWQFYASRGWYNGASDRTGKLPLSTGYSTFYWTLNGNAVVAQGAVFGSLPAGYYYKAAEYYRWQNGATGSRWSFVNGTGAQYCYIG